MDFEFSARTSDYLQRLGAFMDEHIYPNEERFYAQLGEGNRWEEPALLEKLQHKARAARLWNLFLPDSPHGAGLSRSTAIRSVGSNWTNTRSGTAARRKRPLTAPP